MLYTSVLDCLYEYTVRLVIFFKWTWICVSNIMDLSTTSWANIAKSAGDVVSQMLVQPGILAAQAIVNSEGCPEKEKAIAKNGQLFKQAVKQVITVTALLPKTWNAPPGTLHRLLEEAEAPWTLDEIKPHLRVFHRGKKTSLTIGHDLSSDLVINLLINFGLLEASKVTIITHGFMNTARFAWLPAMKDAIFEADEKNGVETDDIVILMDWGSGAFIGVHAYDNAAQNIATVAKWLASHIQLLKEVKEGIYIHTIGHSLGAHLFGVAGRIAKINEIEPCIDRITGLDPAGPGFENYYDLGFDGKHQSLRLTATSAKFVDCIHTDGYSHALHGQAIISPTNHYGTFIPLGDIDFYPNWGHSQPGCSVYNIIGSHLRAIDLFTWSITNPGKLVTNKKLVETPEYMEPAKTWSRAEEPFEMGYYCKPCGQAGNYYVQTNHEEPWISDPAMNIAPLPLADSYYRKSLTLFRLISQSNPYHDSNYNSFTLRLVQRII